MDEVKLLSAAEYASFMQTGVVKMAALSVPKHFESEVWYSKSTRACVLVIGYSDTNVVENRYYASKQLAIEAVNDLLGIVAPSFC